MEKRNSEECGEPILMDENKIASLVPKPSTSDKIKSECQDLLSKLLAEASHGQVSGLIVIVDRPDGSWAQAMTGTQSFGSAIGRIAIVQQHWIGEYLKSMGGRPLG